MSLDGATQQIWALFTWFGPGTSLSAGEVAGLLLAPSTAELGGDSLLGSGAFAQGAVFVRCHLVPFF